ncbi:MAG: GH92 family glycosyl hydrolase [Muribaculaceae bacterium]|nr:GH92 family glycosyl hydrolase [Muribaculaceae bacterium]
MKRAVFSFILAAALASVAFAGNYTRYVNPFIGTGAIDGGLSGNNYPGATVPFGMVQLSPDTHEAPDWYNASGYDHNDSRIYGFSHTRLSGTGACDLIDILLMPTVSDLKVSGFSHGDESASPGYYRVKLSDEDIHAELTATTRAGIHRYTYPSGKERNIWLDLDHSANKGSWDRRIINAQIRQTAPNRIEGYRIITGWAKLRKVYFTIEFSEPVASMTLFDGDGREYCSEDATLVNGRSPRALISFGADGKPLVSKVALSGVSIANARENMNAEAPDYDFDRYVNDADRIWDSHLGKIEVKGNPENMTTFYTALYHMMIQPNTFSDINGQYMTPDYSIDTVPDGEIQYTTFSLWDTYRAAHPLYTIIEPERTRDFVNSMLRHYDYYGYLPIWHLWGQDNYCMIGNHAIPVIADALMKNIPGIDMNHAWEAVRNSSTQSHPNSPFSVWERHGYMPENIQTQSVSITLEMAFDDWCASKVAALAGDGKAVEKFGKRARFYRNLHNPSNNFFAPRDDNGNWIEPFDPLKYGANGGQPFTEGNAWQYYWYVPHDIPGLVELTGGSKAFEQKLDTFFTLTDTSGEKNDNISGLIGQYAHGNEPSHHVAYLYNYIGKPEKTRRMVKHIMSTLYNNNYNGYAGNDDCGEMSAWYVFSAMGFYPVNPASGEYSIGIPLFDECIIHLPSGKDFTITARRRNQDCVNVRKMTLDNKEFKSLSLSHADIVKGGTLHFLID